MENTSTPEQTVSTPPSMPAMPAPDQRQGQPRLFMTFMTILILIAFGCIGWLWINSKRLQTEALAADTKIIQTQTRQNDAIKIILNHVNNLTAQSQQQEQNVLTLQNQIAQVSQMTPSDVKQWKLAEIVYLVRLANIQLTVNHSVPNALTLLNQAETQLLALNDPSLDSFHQTLLQNISTLQSLPEIDIVAITNQLNTLRDQVPSLSILVAPKPNTSVLPPERTAHKKWWQTAWDNIKASMQQLVIVRHQQQTLPALMAPDQQWYLQENLQLQLDQAKWAVLNYQPDLYQSSLHTAKTWVEKYYVQNTAPTQDFLRQLQTLAALNLKQTLPDLNQTLATLNRTAGQPS